MFITHANFQQRVNKHNLNAIIIINVCAYYHYYLLLFYHGEASLYNILCAVR